MSNKRKATDVLLQMESSINTLLGYVRNQDHMIKMLLQKISLLEKQITVNFDKPAPAPSQPQAKPLMPGLKSGVILGQSGLKHVEVEAKSEEELEFPVVEVPAPQGKRRSGRYVSEPNVNSNKPIPVQQSVVYPDGKNVCLANVEIFQEDKLVKKTRTNASGKWITSLEPGVYTVCVFKQSVANKPEVNLSFEIDVHPSDGPIELPKQQVEL